MTKCLAAAILGTLLFVSAPCVASPEETVSARERQDALKRAQVWMPVPVSSMNIKAGPSAHFAPGATVNCTWVDHKYGGRTPKFGCVRPSSPKHVMKVRYGRTNGEIYAGVAASRLLWALGFGADALYPVRVVCTGCPEELAAEGRRQGKTIVFEEAAIEEPLEGEDIEAKGVEPGWSWKELDLVDQNAGGATVEQRDALKLLAAFIQHTDNKAEQQRLVCLNGGKTRQSLAECDKPFLAIHDLGVTFGRANLFNKGNVGSANYEQWGKTNIWRTPEHCVANLAQSQTGTLDDPVISEGGRKFLADLLAKLTDGQIADLFTIARFDRSPNGGAPIAYWVTMFKNKRTEITQVRCR